MELIIATGTELRNEANLDIVALRDYCDDVSAVPTHAPFLLALSDVLFYPTRPLYGVCYACKFSFETYVDFLDFLPM